MATFLFWGSLALISLLTLGTIIVNVKIPKPTYKNLEDFSFEKEDK
jgi:hypothetical protein